MKQPILLFILCLIAINLSAQNDKDVFNIALAEANQGKIKAQLTLASFYLEGKGTEVDTIKAIMELQKSAIKGLTLTQNMLGDILSNKSSAYYDIQQSLSWYIQSAIQGDAHAQTMMALCYYHGYGVKPSKEKAADWLYLAKVNNYEPAIKAWDELELGKHHKQNPKETGLKGFRITEIYYSDYDTAFALPLTEHIITMQFASDTAAGFFGISKMNDKDSSTAFVGVFSEVASRPSIFSEGVFTDVYPISFASALTPEREGEAILTKEYFPKAKELYNNDVCFFQLIFPNKGYELQIYAELIKTPDNN